MPPSSYEELFSTGCLEQIFPPDRSDRFFEAIFGDVEEGAYDIRLRFEDGDAETLRFAFDLAERPGKCLTCSRTYGLPDVFKRHPVIDVQGVVSKIDRLLDGTARCGEWTLERTRELSPGRHAVPLVIRLRTEG
jgi:hypothetical protein